MGREALRLGGSEMHHFVLAASCFLAASEAAAEEEEAMQEGGSVVTPAQVQAALRAAVKAHKRFTGTLHSPSNHTIGTNTNYFTQRRSSGRTLPRRPPLPRHLQRSARPTTGWPPSSRSTSAPGAPIPRT